MIFFLRLKLVLDAFTLTSLLTEIYITISIIDVDKEAELGQSHSICMQECQI